MCCISNLRLLEHGKLSWERGTRTSCLLGTPCSCWLEQKGLSLTPLYLYTSVCALFEYIVLNFSVLILSFHELLCCLLVKIGSWHVFNFVQFGVFGLIGIAFNWARVCCQFSWFGRISCNSAHGYHTWFSVVLFLSLYVNFRGY